MKRTSALVVLILAFVSWHALGCTNLLAGAGASADGSAYITYSCDNCGYGAIRVVGQATYPAGALINVYDEPPLIPDESTADLGPSLLGQIPQVEMTYRYFDLLGSQGNVNLGGMNEHGVCITETTLVGTRPELSNPHAMLVPFSVSLGRSLVTLALQRAKTARKAIQVIGSLSEEYGYCSPYPIEGEQLAITDGTETWSMEIFGPGPDWESGSGKPGAVWCAQRIPDGHVGVSANRSRIGKVDLSDSDFFLASPNIFSLAEEMGWWDSDSEDPFIWYEVYAPSERWSSIIREWRALDLVAPSLDLTPDQGRFPFSVHAERRLTTTDIVAIQRDMLEGTEFDVTEAPGFDIDGDKSPIACPLCRSPLYELVDATLHTMISNRYASLSCVYQVNTEAIEEMRGCAWFGFGPAATTCYVPIYSGATELPEAYSGVALERVDARVPFWGMTLASQLATAQWQDSFEDIRAVRDPAEQTFLAEQACLPAILSQIEGGKIAVTEFLNFYTSDRLAAVQLAYENLVDYLLITYYSPLGPFAPREIPTVGFEALADCIRYDELVEVSGFGAGDDHDPIDILGDARFNLSNSGVVAGTGTAGDPYVIEGWTIEGGQACIRIQDTTKHFVIRDCEVSNGGNGILLVHAKNGIIENCVVRNAASDCSQSGDPYGSCGDGICIYESEEITVSACRVEDSDASGISLYGSSDCLIQGNWLIENGASGIEVSRQSSSCAINDNWL